METGTSARWFLRVSCVEPLAAVQVSMQDTTCASFATDSFLVFTPDPPLFPVFLIEKLQMFRGFSKYLPFPYFFLPFLTFLPFLPSQIMALPF